MRRVGSLFDAIVEPANLRLAFCRAACGKRHRPEVRRFAATLDEPLAEMCIRLLAGTFPVGRFRQFEIHDPKRRMITAPVFPERVLHHAIVGVCEAYFKHWLLADTFACRPSKGREAAVLRAAGFSRRFPWLVHLDVRQCFDSIPHVLLGDRLARRFKDRRLLDLFAAIIAGFRGDTGRGLPIGSLTFQHFTIFSGLARPLRQGASAAGTLCPPHGRSRSLGLEPAGHGEAGGAVPDVSRGGTQPRLQARPAGMDVPESRRNRSPSSPSGIRAQGELLLEAARCW